jgi:hypothetical protein
MYSSKLSNRIGLTPGIVARLVLCKYNVVPFCTSKLGHLGWLSTFAFAFTLAFDTFGPGSPVSNPSRRFPVTYAPITNTIKIKNNFIESLSILIIDVVLKYIILWLLYISKNIFEMK